MKRVEKLKRELQKIKKERDKLRMEFETFMLDKQHDQVVTELKRLPPYISMALYTFKPQTKEHQVYCLRKCHLMNESNHLQHTAKMLWKEIRELVREQNTLEESIKGTKNRCEEGSLKIHAAKQ